MLPALLAKIQIATLLLILVVVVAHFYYDQRKDAAQREAVQRFFSVGNVHSDSRTFPLVPAQPERPQP